MWYQKNQKEISTLANLLVDDEYDKLVIVKKNFIPTLDIDVLHKFGGNIELDTKFRQEFDVFMNESTTTIRGNYKIVELLKQVVNKAKQDGRKRKSSNFSAEDRNSHRNELKFWFIKMKAYL